MGRALLRRLLAGCCLAALPLAGCAGSIPVASNVELPARSQQTSQEKSSSPVQPVSHEYVVPAPTGVPREMPITLDAVLRIAEGTNARIAVAREKLNESQINAEQTGKGWMPNVYAGGA